MTYEINWIDGTSEDHDSFQEAIESVRMQYSGAYCMHEYGQWEVGASDTAIEEESRGGRVLIWSSLRASVKDDGRNAVGSIRLRGGDQ